MKLLSLTLLVFLCFTQVATAQTAEQIPSMTRVQKSYDYYFEQSVLWERELKKSPKNKNAWLNYFLAARYANHFSKEAVERFDLQKIVEDAKEAIPESFESYYIEYRLYSDCNKLYKANELDPDRTIALHDLQTCYLVDGDVKNAEEYVKKWYNTGDWSPAIFKWNYNVLASLAPNALMLSWGDNDSYPVYALQSVKKIRQDVGLIVMPLLWKDDYRNHVFAQNNIAPFGKNSSEFPDELAYYSAIVDHIQASSKRPLYVGVAGSKRLKNKYEDSLYLVGLTYKFSVEPFDNIAEIQDNYEHKFLLDDLKVDLSNDISRPIADQLNSNYIPAFVLLHKKYINTHELDKAQELRQIVLEISERNHKGAEIKKYFKSTRPIKYSGFKIKKLEKAMKKVKEIDNLYANRTEVTIEQYNLFIQDLGKNHETEIIKRCLFAPTNWVDLLTEEQKKIYAKKQKTYDKDGNVVERWMLDTEKNELRNPSSPDFPIQNISWEAANEYCSWLTRVYNSSTSRKKKFKKVIFRLPTEAEWELAASGGLKLPNYSWGGFGIANAKGCFLCNFDAPACKDCKHQKSDGAVFTASADAYFPNNYGLYNTAGNVAEMIANPKITKGGGWQSTAEQCKIANRVVSDAPSPNVGFRVFMEVIEK